MEPTDERAGAPAVPGDDLLRAWASAPGQGGPLDEAARSGVLRRPGEGHILGVCAALASGGGVPVRLVRLAALGLLALGIGLPLYLCLALVLPRERPAADGELVVDTPWNGLRQREAGRGDVLTLLSIIPAGVLACIWLWFLLSDGPGPLLLIGPIEAALLLILLWGAARARRARRSFLVASLAARAGIVDEARLAEALELLREQAPRAWAGEDAADASPAHPAVRPARRRRNRAEGLALRPVLASSGVLVAVGTAVFLLISTFPHLAPAFALNPPLPGIGRVGVAAGVTTVVAGAMLIAIGASGRRAPAIAAIGSLAFIVFSASVVWVRVTDATATTPITVAVSRYVPGERITCPGGGPRDWDRTVVIDMSAMQKPPSRDDLLRSWEERHPGSGGGPADLTMQIDCSRGVGDVTVLLPPASSDVPVRSSMEASLGQQHGTIPSNGTLAVAGDSGIQLSGRLGTGSIRYEEAPE